MAINFTPKNATTSSVQFAPTAQKKSFLQKTSDFLGFTPLAKGIASALFKYTPESKNLDATIANNDKTLNELTQTIINKKRAGEDVSKLMAARAQLVQSQKQTNASRLNIETGGGLTNRQVIGSAANVAATLPFSAATLGFVPKAAKAGAVGSKILPIAKEFALEGGIGGAAAGFGQGMIDKNKSATDVIGSTIAGGALGAAFGGALGIGAPLAGRAFTKATSEIKPGAIMQRIARISPLKQELFKKKAGETVGEYLTNRKIFGDVPEIVQQLYSRMSTSKGRVDAALAEMRGTHKFEPVKTMLTDLFKREKGISSIGAPSRDVEKVASLLAKYNEGGLTMEEINEVKRLYESNVKLDYLKANLPDKIERANTVDTAVRNWQLTKAHAYGFKDLQPLNKETQLARQLADDLWKTYARKEANNSVSLTDWLVLTGDPTGVSIPAYITKKVLSAPKIQAGIAARQSMKLPTKDLPTGKLEPFLGLPSGSTPFKVSIPSGETIPLANRTASTIDAQQVFPRPTTGLNINPQETGLLPSGTLPAGFKAPVPEQINLPARSASTMDSVIPGSSRKLPQQSPRIESPLLKSSNNSITPLKKVQLPKNTSKKFIIKTKDSQAFAEYDKVVKGRVLNDLAVDSASQNKGVGSTILKKFEEWAKKNGDKIAYVKASPDAVSYYTDRGYKPYNTFEDFVLLKKNI